MNNLTTSPHNPSPLPTQRRHMRNAQTMSIKRQTTNRGIDVFGTDTLALAPSMLYTVCTTVDDVGQHLLRQGGQPYRRRRSDAYLGMSMRFDQCPHIRWWNHNTSTIRRRPTRLLNTCNHSRCNCCCCLSCHFEE